MEALVIFLVALPLLGVVCYKWEQAIAEREEFKNIKDKKWEQ